NASGKPCAKFRREPRQPMPRLRNGLAHPRPHALWEAPAAPTISPSRFHVIGGCGAMAIFPATVGASSASVNCCGAKRKPANVGGGGSYDSALKTSFATSVLGAEALRAFPNGGCHAF